MCSLHATRSQWLAGCGECKEARGENRTGLSRKEICYV
ncbi:protein of unknown function [Magnetospirillum sp. XM-1]|nr:protein of unknown function [Magnetospirillum sp. XM-1]